MQRLEQMTWLSRRIVKILLGSQLLIGRFVQSQVLGNGPHHFVCLFRDHSRRLQARNSTIGLHHAQIVAGRPCSSICWQCLQSLDPSSAFWLVVGTNDAKMLSDESEPRPPEISNNVVPGHPPLSLSKRHGLESLASRSGGESDG